MSKVRDFLREFRENAGAVALFVVIVAALVVPAWVQSRVDDAQNQIDRAVVEITCANAQASIAELTALRAVGLELGIPISFSIPEVPDECDGT